jgi:hypothetical protein
MRCTSCPVLTGITCFNDTRNLTGRCTSVGDGDAQAVYQAGTNSEGPSYLCRTDPAYAATVGVDCSATPPVWLADVPPGVIAQIDPLAAQIEGCRFRVSTCNCMTKPAVCLGYGFPTTVTVAEHCRRCPEVVGRRSLPT